MIRLGPAHWAALFLGVACILFQVLDLAFVLRFDRHAIFDGQWWRLISGNLVHLGTSHLLLNLAGLAVISYLVGDALSLRQWAVVFVACLLGVSFGLLLFDPQLSWYVGLSGALYGLLVAGAIAEFRYNRPISLVLIAYTIARTGYEQWYGAAASSEALTGGKVIVNAHLYGLISGICVTLLLLAPTIRAYWLARQKNKTG